MAPKFSNKIEGREYLKTPEAARYIGVCETQMAKMRQRGDGPAFTILGVHAFGYEVKDLDKWIKRMRSAC